MLLFRCVFQSISPLTAFRAVVMSQGREIRNVCLNLSFTAHNVEKNIQKTEKHPCVLWPLLLCHPLKQNKGIIL